MLFDNGSKNRKCYSGKIQIIVNIDFCGEEKRFYGMEEKYLMRKKTETLANIFVWLFLGVCCIGDID